MSACEKCWRDAHWPGSDVAVEYAKLVAARICTPEEQAGPEATVCPNCGRRTLHQWTGECMAGCLFFYPTFLGVKEHDSD